MLRSGLQVVLSVTVLFIAAGSAEAGRSRGLGTQEHVLTRAGYGVDAWSRNRIASLGSAGYLLEQLDPASLDDSALEAQLAQFPSLTMDFLQLRIAYGGAPDQLPLADVRQELLRARLLRAIASRRQLQEVLVDFWFNHFNVQAELANPNWDISPYERIAIRPHVLGRFEDMLLAVARSPAMGDYLDNRKNVAGAINENFGREIMELYTLGVDGGYTEADVVEVARCLTGWQPDYTQPDGFAFVPSLHDQGTKTIMGTLQIPANGGYQDGLDVIDFLTSHPATAHFLSTKLVRRLVADDPPDGLVNQAAAVFLATDGDLRAVTQVILQSPEFILHAGEFQADPRKSKVKRPMAVVASAARALGADTSALDLDSMLRRAREMGEDLYRWSPPTGYSENSAYWSGPGVMIMRFNSLERFVRGGDGFVITQPVSGGTSAEIVDALVAQYFLNGVSEDTRDGAIAFVDSLAVADIFRVRQAAAYLLSSPEFLSH